jgi:BlaR1 peptidase M56
MTLTIALDPLSPPALESLWPVKIPLSEPLSTSVASEPGVPGQAHGENYQAVNWRGLATAIYAGVACVLLLRMAVGICLTWRLVRAAKPLAEPWAGGSDVRVSNAIGGPVTFGSTILLPPQCIDWNLPKRRAVLAHEAAHVVNRDFYVLLLASLNRAAFWFSPFAWWHLVRLAELAEIISDARALEVVEDKLSYAEILLDLVQHFRRPPAALEMARACTLRARVERILAATTAPAKAGWRKRLWTAVAILPVVAGSATTIAYSTPPVSALAIEAAEATTAAPHKPELVDFYSLGRASIFAVFRQGDALFGQLSGQRKFPLSAEGDGTLSYPAAAGHITLAVGEERKPELMLRQNGRDVRAVRIAQTSRPGIEADASLLDSYVGWYELNPNRVLTVTRDGDRMHVQETGRPAFEVTSDGADAFSSNHDDLVIFLRDSQAKATQLLFQDPMSGARLAPRVDAARARLIEQAFARQIADIPDRFRDQTPVPGSKDAILRGVADMQRGAPNYDRMSTMLAAKVRRQVSQLQSMFKALGAVETIFFRGVGPGGYDIYGVKFANGFAEFRILLGADGNTDDVIFRPDGDDAPGGVAACSEEPGLRSRSDAAPIRLLIYNGSGKDVQLSRLDAEGKRIPDATIGENTSSAVLTYVDSPWVITDTSGRCLEIVVAGQTTRYHNLAPPGASQPERPASSRATPLAESEQMLRQYIESLSRGEPIYDRMTSEVAAQTRRALALDQAILTKLGALRAVSFRGVSALGSDVYIAHFANGSAEWRIGLIKDGTIGRIALGPQF